MKRIPQFLLAAPTSGSGKTTVCRLLMSALTKRGLHVQPFKCGPDYIDTKFHAVACGRPSLNLDTFMASTCCVEAIYTHYAQRADVCIVEGMMGMYDGYDRDKGSSAEIASILDIPVILVVDAKSAAYSIAPLLKGFMEFRPNIKIAGVIFNKVNSAQHYNMLCQVTEELELPCFGYIQKCKDIELSSRYLGLNFTKIKEKDMPYFLEYVQVDQLLESVMRDVPKDNDSYLANIPPRGWNICVAKNEESFSFLYQEHVDMMEKWGHITYFNPEEDFTIPRNTDLLYLPGGYPEKHLDDFSEYTMHEIYQYGEHGGRIWAECGGMMYLCKEIRTHEGSRRMVGLFNHVISAEDEHRKLSLGYRKLQLPNGLKLRGHEFHYTQFVGQRPQTIAEVRNARNEIVDSPFFKYKNVTASYTHLYWNYGKNIHKDW